MAHISKITASADEHILDVTADPDTQAADLERLVELARTASPKTRARLEHTIAVIAHGRQIRSMTLTSIQQLHSMDSVWLSGDRFRR
jgi:hypothetical protein